MNWLAARASLGFCAALMSLSLLASSVGGQVETVKIVSSLPRTGWSKGQTDAIVNSFRMALDEAGNQAGGYAIVYEDLDDATPLRGAWDAGKEAANANQAVDDPDVMVYLGTFNSGASKISMPILNRAGLVMISPANTYPGLTKPVPGVANEPAVYRPSGQVNYTRVVPADDLQGTVGALWARRLGAQRVYVLDDTELFGHLLAVEFANTAQRVGLQLSGGPEGIDPRAPEYVALAARVAAAKPDLVYFGGITQNNAGRLFRDLRAALGPGPKLMASDGLYEEAFLRDAGPAAEGTYITFGGVAARMLTGRGAAWYAAYKARFNSEPEVYAAYGYEAMQVALAAIKRAGARDREAIRAAVLATKDYDGVLGRWSFDANGDTTITTMSGRQVSNGRFDDANAIILTADEAPPASATPRTPG